MRRGDVRAAILLLLAELPRNGYQVMHELEERSGGSWRPSPGSVYPALQLLADEGFVRGEIREGQHRLRADRRRPQASGGEPRAVRHSLGGRRFRHSRMTSAT